MADRAVDNTADAPPRPNGGPPRGAEDRVRLAHRQVRWSAPVIVVLAVAGLGADLAGSPWAALHLVMAGAVVSLISTVAIMLTVTWSAAPAPADWLVAIQRAAVAGGVALAVAGLEADSPDWVPVLGAAIYGAGLVLLAFLLVVTVRRGVQRRYDAAVAGYVAAIAAGVVGAILGATMAASAVTVARRDAHRIVNLLGLVGIVIAITLPYFVATVGRSKMAPWTTPRRLYVLVAALAAAVLVAVTGVATSTTTLSAIGLSAYGASLLAVLALMPRPTRRQLTWAGPRLVALWLGIGWWLAAVISAVAAVTSDRSPLAAPWTVVLLVAGYGQIVWGSLAYLLPVIRGGGHERLSAGFALTRSWLGLAAVNATGLALVGGQSMLAKVFAALWLIDFAVRGLWVVASGRHSAPVSVRAGR